MTLDPFELFIRLLAAVFSGVAIGLNRDLHHKSAGVRTFGLVSLGAGIVILVIEQTAGSGPDAISRVIQGILTGIGFLGAGVILHQVNNRRVTGLTTAAAVWLAAGLGVACGVGLYELALMALCLSLLILLLGRPVEKFAVRLLRRPTRIQSHSSRPNAQPSTPPKSSESSTAGEGRYNDLDL